MDRRDRRCCGAKAIDRKLFLWYFGLDPELDVKQIEYDHLRDALLIIVTSKEPGTYSSDLGDIVTNYTMEGAPCMIS